MFTAASGEFGVAKLVTACRPPLPDHRLASTFLFLPPPQARECLFREVDLIGQDPPLDDGKSRSEVLESFHLPVFKEEPPAPGHWFESKGKSLASAGWLNVYQKGYLHGDVSIGNVLSVEEDADRPFAIDTSLLSVSR
ncbi:hypothetical protein FISHEDRAFT_72926 [Fistulina hepatica ATCC 64428]|uniref:Fungal-type protein kinase domain-containing protein n=1 Tax=Fistulina hepatica ATCC 64428 TaxID=1128425 RepID=A0A0D7AFJ2_9AGAR|nr:hypothetical protein FISHEDRAFT_72926 [Fistulina hepatica ATCC 64428]